MGTIRPPGFIESGRNPASFRHALVITVAALAVICGWQLFGLPGHSIKRNVGPPDFRGVDYGLRQLWIEADGTWTMTREGYLDRMQTYVITPARELSRYHEKLAAFEERDVSGVAHGSAKNMAGNRGLKIKGSPSYFKMLQELRPDDVPGAISYVTEQMQRERDATTGMVRTSAAAPEDGADGADSANAAPAADQPAGVFSPPGYTDTEPASGVVDEKQLAEEDGIIVAIYDYSAQTEELRQVLPGHVYYSSLDSYAYIDPNLWIVADRQEWLHRVEAIEVDGELVLTPVASVPLDIRNRSNRDCKVGLDPLSSELFIALANGELLWFDALSLEYLREEKLPGEWRQEFASLAFSALAYSPYEGWPLSQPAYRRVMAVLMVVFIASLLALITVGRKAWKFTWAATTADTSSSSKSAITSADADTPASTTAAPD